MNLGFLLFVGIEGKYYLVSYIFIESLHSIFKFVEILTCSVSFSSIGSQLCQENWPGTGFGIRKKLIDFVWLVQEDWPGTGFWIRNNLEWWLISGSWVKKIDPEPVCFLFSWASKLQVHFGVLFNDFCIATVIRVGSTRLTREIS